jgi:sec-independent protein translocase protein TatA
VYGPAGSESWPLALPIASPTEVTVMFAPLGFFFGGMPGPLEMLIIAVIVLLLFGNRLPGVMRSLGKGIVEFKKGVQGIEEEVDKAGNAKKDE